MLKNRWVDLCEILKIEPTVSNKWWERILEQYSKNYYHNLRHIENFFKQYLKYKSRVNEPVIFEMSIFFHDIIYNPKTTKKDNEIRSAEEFEVFYKESMLNDEKMLKRVKDIIIATKDHLASAEKYFQINDNDVLMFLDLDLSILAESEEEYEIYAGNIRKEYSNFDLETYVKNRSKFLDYMNSKDKIFFILTDLKEIAVKNMKWEKEVFLKSLKE